ncbi:3-phenylpropionate/trans-cinnamate dioxygenase ferredoxin reductase subunit [Rhizobium leguminosarum]
MTGVVIIGAGHAGVELAFTLRDVGYTDPITILDKSAHIPYERPPISKGWITGNASPDELALRSLDSFVTAKIDLRLSCNAREIDRQRKVVSTDSGPFSYNKLVLALGSRPRSLTMPGHQLRGVHQLHTLEHAAELRVNFAHATRVGVVGAGFIGLELASLAAKRGIPVTVVETASRVMPRTASEILSHYMRAQHEKLGTKFHFSSAVEKIVGSADGVEGLQLSDGTVIDADLVILGIGGLANGEWLAACGIEYDNGIVVDKSLRTSDPNIFAIGDCARFEDDEGALMRLESIGNAADQARRTAAGIAGKQVPVADVPWFWTQQAGVRVQMAGRVDRVREWLLMGDEEKNSFSVLGWKGERLVYGESVNSPSDHVNVRKILAGTNNVTFSHLRSLAGMGLTAAVKAAATARA